MKERAQKEVAKEQQEADQPIINPGLLLTYPGQAPPQTMMPNGTGMPQMGVPPVRVPRTHRPCVHTR